MTQRDMRAADDSLAVNEEKDLLALLEAPESAEERLALDGLAGDPRRVLAAARLRAGPGSLRIRRLPTWIAGAAVAAACVVGVGVVVARAPRDPLRVLADVQGEARPLEIGLSGLPWAPYRPARGGRERKLDSALRELLEAREKQ